MTTEIIRFASGINMTYMPRLVDTLEQHWRLVAEAYNMDIQNITENDTRSNRDCSILVVMNLFLKDEAIKPLLELAIDEPTLRELALEYGEKN